MSEPKVHAAASGINPREPKGRGADWTDERGSEERATERGGKEAPSGAPEASAIALRVCLLVKDLQRQFAAYLGTPTRARGYPPFEGQHSLIVEVAPALAIERVTDLALRAVPAVEPGILFVERQFGVLEVHAEDLADVERAGQAILAGLGADPADQLRPRILFSDVIEDLTDRQAVIINRNRGGSMVLPGDTLGVCEMTPALFATVAANEAERAAPGVTLVDVSMIGVAGRIYLAGQAADVTRAQQAMVDVLAAVEGRDQSGGGRGARGREQQSGGGRGARGREQQSGGGRGARGRDKQSGGGRGARGRDKQSGAGHAAP